MKINNCEEAFKYIESFRNYEKSAQFSTRDFRLDRMAKLLEIFDEPHKLIKTFHIAGTKGKGSTALFLSSLLISSGFKTGLYTSPHVLRYNERIQVQNEEADGNIITFLTCRIQSKINQLMFSPTTFELLTLLGFLYFKELECNYAVIETGLGGRLDATNIISPLASIITPIDLEHTEFLGDKLESIAFEKAGIIKPATPVFCSAQSNEAEIVIRQRAMDLNCKFFLLNNEILISSLEHNFNYQKCEFYFKKKNKKILVELKMIGDFQRENAALAALVYHYFFPSKYEIHVPLALKNAFLPGRMEILNRKPLILIDGAHTINSIEKLIFNINQFTMNSPKILLFGCFADKKAEDMIKLLQSDFDEIILTHPSDIRQFDLNSLIPILDTKKQAYTIIENTDTAIQESIKKVHDQGSLIITGSFHLIGRVKEIISKFL